MAQTHHNSRILHYLPLYSFDEWNCQKKLTSIAKTLVQHNPTKTTAPCHRLPKKNYNGCPITNKKK